MACVSLINTLIAIGSLAAPILAQQQLFKYTAPTPVSGDSLGASVDVDGPIAIAGARAANVQGASNAGEAYLFDSLSGALLSTLHHTDNDTGVQFDELGWSVAVSGQLAVVGAPGDDNTTTNAGSAFVFDVATGLQLFQLNDPAGHLNDKFGESVSIHGSRIVVGCRGDDDEGDGAGAAYVFDANSGAQLFKLTASDAGDSHRFGWSVAVFGTRIVVGAPDAGLNMPGKAYVFDAVTGAELFSVLDATTVSDDFGFSVAINGTSILVGDPHEDQFGSDSGKAFLFDLATGQLLDTITAPDPGLQDRFGFAVSLSGNLAVVGAENDSPPFQSGSAYLFDLTGVALPTKYLPADASNDQKFGAAVAVDCDRVIVGAFGDNGTAGAAYGFGTRGAATAAQYGSGWPGTLGIPGLTSGGPPVFGDSITLQLGNSSGQPTNAYFFVGFSSIAQPTGYDGILLAQPDVIVPLLIPGSGLRLPVTIPADPLLCGVTVFLQCVQSDPGASKNFSFSPGLALQMASY